MSRTRSASARESFPSYTPPRSYSSRTRMPQTMPSYGNDRYNRSRPVPPPMSGTLPVYGRNDRKPATGTWQTPAGTVVHRDNSGNITYPSRSRIGDIHLSNSGKSWVVDHNDGIREIHDINSGKITYARAPQSQTRYIAPPSAPRINYGRRAFNYNDITINQYNTYLRSQNYYVSEPVFYQGYRWQPPVFAPVLLTAGLTMLAMDALYSNQYYPSGYTGVRDSVFNMAGTDYYAAEYEQAGIHDSYDLLAAGRTPDQRANLSYITGIPYSEVRKDVGQADLMRVYGIGPKNSRLLADAGIESVQDLARYTWDPAGLLQQLQYSSYWDGQNPPSLYDVENWISQARDLPVAIYDDGSQQPSIPGGGPVPPPVDPQRPVPPPVEPVPPPVPPQYIPVPSKSSW